MSTLEEIRAVITTLREREARIKADLPAAIHAVLQAGAHMRSSRADRTRHAKGVLGIASCGNVGPANERVRLPRGLGKAIEAAHAQWLAAKDRPRGKE